MRKIVYGLLFGLFAVTAAYALSVPYGQSDRTRQNRARQAAVRDSAVRSTPADSIKAQPVIVQDDTIPDSLLHPRWKIQRITPVTEDDLDTYPADLSFPENIKQEVVYDDSLDRLQA